MAINKVIYGGTTLIDLTADTVTANVLLTGYTSHAASGESITGVCNYDVDSTDATVQVSEILIGETAYARGALLTGTMPNNGSVISTISTVDQVVSIAQGYHDGGGSVSIDSTEQEKIIAGNIKNGVVILGITGTFESSSSVTAQAKTVTPTTSSQTVLPDTDYDYLSQVVVDAIPYTETVNSAGGTTVTIG